MIEKTRLIAEAEPRMPGAPVAFAWAASKVMTPLAAQLSVPF